MTTVAGCTTVLCLSTMPVFAQPTAPSDSSRIKGLADTPDHPVLMHKKGRTTIESVARFPARAIKYGFETGVKLASIPLSLFIHPATSKDIRSFGRFLGRNHIYLADGGQGDGSSFGVELGLIGRLGVARPLTVTLSSAMTIRTYQTHALRFHQVLSPKMALRAWGQYRIRPRENFYGIGPGTTLEGQTRYNQSDVNIGGMLSYALSRVRISGTMEWSDYRIKDGSGNGLLSSLDVYPGLIGSNGAELLSAGVGVNFPLILYIRPGWDTGIDASVRTYWDTNGSQFGFTQYMLSLYQAMPLFWGDRVLGVRVTGIASDQRGQSNIPFYLLSRLGGSANLRGFDNLRFRDKHAFVVNAEYRYPIWNIGINRGTTAGLAADIVLFIDSGLVFNSFDQDFKTDNFATDYGGGFRLRTQRNIMARIIVARSSEATRLVVRLGRDF